MDLAFVASMVGSITTLAGSLGGYWVAGRNDDARDDRAAKREASARHDALAERLDEDRHTFQRDTLLQLQDDLQLLVRTTAQILIQDEATLKRSSQLYLLPGTLNDEAMQITVSVQRLRARVLDDQLREAVGQLVALCAASSLGTGYPDGKVPEDQRVTALSKIKDLHIQLGKAYESLTELLGSHIRRELNRQPLASTAD